MKKLSIIAMCLVASVLMACGGGSKSGSGSGEKYDLYYKLEPGKVYSQNMAADMKMSPEIMGQKMDMRMKMAFGMDYAIKDTTGGVITGDFKFTSIEMSMETPMGNFSFSSEDDGSNQNPMIPFDASKIFKSMKEASFEMSISKYGKVESMSGLEDMMDNMFSSLGLSSSEIAQARGIMEQSFSEEKMMEQMRNIEIYPNHPVAIGDSWTMNVVNAQMDMENTYTLKEVNDNEIVIEVNSKIKDMAIEGFSGNLEGTQTGSTIVHRSSGWIKKGDLKQNISGSGTMQGMNAKITMNSEITIKD